MFLHTANVTKLPIFKEEEVLSPRDFVEPFNGVFRKVIDDISVGFQNTDAVAHIFGEAEQGRRSVNIR